MQCSPDVDSYNGIFTLNSDNDSERDKDSDETDIEEELIISKKPKTRTGEEDTVTEITYSSRLVNEDLKIRKKSTIDSSNEDDKHAPVFSEECDAPASNQNHQHNTQSEMMIILSDEEDSAVSAMYLIFCFSSDMIMHVEALFVYLL